MFIFFLTLLIISLVIIFFVIIRKFPQLSNLDTNSLPQEKVAQTKKKIIYKRLAERGGTFSHKLFGVLIPLGKFWKLSQSKFRDYVNKIYRLWQHEDIARKKMAIESTGEDKEIKIQHLLNEAEESLVNGRLDDAENYYISIISLETKNVPAYRGLADIYINKRELEEARQTLLFLTRIEPDDDAAFVKLAEIAESQGDLEEAINCYQKAVLINDAVSPRFYHLTELLLKVNQPLVAREAIVQAIELEPQNPKYLDLLIETAIICHDKDLALKGYNDLRIVNVENQKLDGFRDRIDRLRVEQIKR